jgi:hypothetical protein
MGGPFFLTLEGCLRVLAGGEALEPLFGVRELLKRACVRNNVLNSKSD